MFREMRRKNQALSKEVCEEVLKRGTSGVLAVLGDEGYPYAVPLSYVYIDGRLFFHCAKTGHKIDAIMKEPKASFCVIDQDKIVPEKYTTYFRSVIIFGKVRIIENEAEKRVAIEKLAIKYAPDDSAAGRNTEIEQTFARLCMLELCIDHMSGKEARELVENR